MVDVCIEGVVDFEMARSAGTICEFSTDDSLLAVGGGSAQQVVLHEMATLDPVGRFTLGGIEQDWSRQGGDRIAISASSVSEKHVALGV